MRCVRTLTWTFFLVCLVVATAARPGLCGAAQQGSRVIDVGSRKQLFIDDRFIASSEGVRLTMNPPVKMNDPVLANYIPWEGEQGASAGTYSSVVKDGGKVRIWGAGKALLPVSLKSGGPVIDLYAYAESDDGVRFTKPEPDRYRFDEKLAEVGKHGRTGGVSVWVDPHGPPSERYKTQAKFYPPNASAEFHVCASPDGYRWTLLCKPAIEEMDTQSIAFWDERLAKYLLYTRKNLLRGTPGRYRVVRRFESADLLNWQNEVFVMQADEIDQSSYAPPTPQPPVDYYGAAVFKYPEDSPDSVYVMLAQAFWHWQRRPVEQRQGGYPDHKFSVEVLAPATLDVRLAVSRDGIRFQRVGDRKPFIGLGTEGTFSAKRTWALPNPIRMGNELWIYYFGENRDHDGFVDPAASKYLCGIDRAILRLDGFVSADADYAGGEIVTPPITFAGKRLELNFDGGAGGTVCVEFLDENDKPIEGYSGAAAEPLFGNSVRLPVRWGDRTDVSSLAGKPIKIRFRMRDCKLYAFQFVE